MILSGSKRAATSRAKRRMTRIGMSAPRYQRGAAAFVMLRGFLAMPSLYTTAARTASMRELVDRWGGRPEVGLGKEASAASSLLGIEGDMRSKSLQDFGTDARYAAKIVRRFKRSFLPRLHDALRQFGSDAR